MLTSSRYEGDSITVERSTVSRDADGVSQTGTNEVLSCKGDAQSLSIAAEERPAAFDGGGLRFFATESVLPCRPGDDATVTFEEGDTLEATVERVEETGDVLVLSYERVT